VEKKEVVVVEDVDVCKVLIWDVAVVLCIIVVGGVLVV
jgi:hypothetical protein